jgi:hypothetical protein
MTPRVNDIHGTVLVDSEEHPGLAMRPGFFLMPACRRRRWEGCARFVDREGNPAVGVRLSLTPEEEAGIGNGDREVEKNPMCTVTGCGRIRVVPIRE